METQTLLNWKRLLITTAIVLVAAAATGGTTYYILNQNFQRERDANQKALDDVNSQLKAEEAKDKTSATTTSATTDPTANWKTYNSVKYGLSFKYPTGWEVVEDVSAALDGSNYFGGDIFSSRNIIIKNPTSQYAVGININPEYGRGGTCVKRLVRYNASVVNKLVALNELSDITTAVGNAGDMCSGPQAGFSATMSEFSYGNNKYFIHSESRQVSDTVANDAIDNYEKIARTIRFN